MALMTPSFLPSQSYPFGPGGGKTGLRYVFEQLPIQAGVAGQNDLKAVQRAAGANLSVDVPAGGIWHQGRDTARQGMYHAYNDAVVNVPVAANASGNPRFDQLVVRIPDSAIAGASDTPTFQVLTGTPNASTDIDNRTGAAALPTDAERICEWVTPNGAAAITNAMIRDRRAFAIRGVVLADVDLTAQALQATSSTSFATIPGASLGAEVGSKHPITQELRGLLIVSGSSQGILRLAGQSTTDPNRFDSAGTSQLTYGGKLVEFEHQPAAGRFAAFAQWRVQAGTASFRGASTNQSSFTVRQ